MMKHVKASVLLLLSGLFLSQAVFFQSISAQPQRTERPKEAITSPTTGMRDSAIAPTVKIWTDKGNDKSGSYPIYYVGERIYVSFQVNKDSYVTLYDIDSTGNVTILFPNPYHKDNLARGGRIYTIPTSNYQCDLVIQGPTGKEILYALVSNHIYYHWQYGVMPPPLWSDQWGSPMNWGHTNEPDQSITSRRFQQRLQVHEETNLAALTLATIKKQIELDLTVGCASGMSPEACQCSFYVTIPPY